MEIQEKEEIEKETKEVEKNENQKTEHEEKNEETTLSEKSNGKNKKAYIIIITGIIILLIILLSTIFALINVNSTKIVSKTYIQGIEISGLDREEAYKAIETALNQNMEKSILIKYNDYETSLTAEQIEVKFNIQKAIEEAYNIGRKGNIISNNYDIILNKLFGKDIELEIEYSEEKLEKILADIATKIPNAVIENTHYIEDDKLIITRGKKGVIINKETLKAEIINNIKKQEVGKQYIEISAEIGEPTQIDINKIHNEIYKEAKDAYFTTEPFNIYVEEQGIDFAISIEEAKNLLKEYKEEYIIPLKITQPNITIDKIGTEAFPHELSTFTTKYDESNRNRSTNIRLASEKINGLVLMPGETFSYNSTVGERTASAGYKEASVYSGGKIVNGIGGGICQVSSTIYNSVLLANLEIVYRVNHCFLPSYVKAGRDATVSYGTIDFQFKNNRKYPIKIICTSINGIVECTIKGIKEEVEYEVVIENKITSTIPRTTQYIEDSSVPAGEERVIQNGFNGFRSETYKTLKYNGAVVSTTLISKDTYDPMQRIVARGTYSAPEPEITVNPTPTTPEPPSQEGPTPSNPEEPTNIIIEEN